MDITTVSLPELFGNFSTEISSRAAPSSNCDDFANFVIYFLISGMVCLLGFAGNSISFIVLAKDKETPVATFLLQALAFTDNFFLCSWFLQFSLNGMFVYMKLTSDFGVAWLYFRLYTYPLAFVGQTATIWMTVLIAASRYVAVCMPYSAPKYCSLPMMKKGVVVVALFSVLYNVPRYFEATVSDAKPRLVGNVTVVGKTLARTSLGKSQLYSLIYFDVLYYIFCFVLPLLMLTFLNTKLTLAYRVVQKRRHTMTSGSHAHHNDHNITLVMIIVVLVFILCNAPARIVQIIYGYRIGPCPSASFMISAFSTFLEVFNSGANFLIYCIFREQFRHNLRHRLCALGSHPGYTASTNTKQTVNGMTTANTLLGDERGVQSCNV